MERDQRVFFIEEAEFIKKIESTSGNRVFLQKSSDLLPIINTTNLDMCRVKKVLKHLDDNAFLVSVCIRLINKQKYDYIFISSSMENMYSQYFILFLEKFCKYKNIQIHCSYTMPRDFISTDLSPELVL
ncbi:hypothetical protein NEPAR06_1397 [Nematocida parisii]|nr:hypothetical protein NEPAR07_0608 [Nematocida parisii]KAI5154931.1 hypothetical protein NEPAR06_1397 [Nematocida parisii]KAI5156312.1 hypothetical protein NEPAR05_0473 [Nematocida parisii]